MFEIMLTVAIGLIGGVAVGTQTPIAGAMAQRVGGTAGSFIVHLGGLVASLDSLWLVLLSIISVPLVQ